VSIKKNDSIDLTKFDEVFCDSLQALDWAYNNGLKKTATIKTSAPALLWKNEANIKNIEKRWTVNELNNFQDTIKKLTENIFDAVKDQYGIEREIALTVSQTVYRFQKVIYKVACLEEDDFSGRRLFIYVDGKTGPAGNIMNSPWDQVLVSNPLFSTVNYTLTDDSWSVLTTQGVSRWKRFKVAGYETVIYRLAEKLMNKIPDRMFAKEVIMPNENELNIEIASELALQGVKVAKISLDNFNDSLNVNAKEYHNEIYELVYPVIRARVEKWVTPSAIEVSMSLFKSYLNKKLLQFDSLSNQWGHILNKKSIKNRVVLVNAPGNIKGHALSYACRKNDIPLLASQHGVTVEISEAHRNISVGFDNSIADVSFAYNSKIIDVEKKTYFHHSKHYLVGMPFRNIRMKQLDVSYKTTPPIVYISTNLYHMGLCLSTKTDYGRAKDEQDMVTLVLSQLPHKVRYKTYPEDNRRYADTDPLLNDVIKSTNIELFNNKVDMRYLVSDHRILVTACATSTLGWPVMSGKPVIFINQKNNNPLKSDAHKSLSKGLFVFDDDDPSFHNNLMVFLSQPLEIIEGLWEKKKNHRKEMIREYFTEYQGGAGKRAAKKILREYL